MTAKIKKIEVIPVGKGWALKRQGDKKFYLITTTKKEAINHAKMMIAWQLFLIQKFDTEKYIKIYVD